MSTAVAPPRTQADLYVHRGLLSWLATTDHKRIGIMYFAATTSFFFLAGVLALLVRTQLAHAGLHFLGAQAYN